MRLLTPREEEEEDDLSRRVRIALDRRKVTSTIPRRSNGLPTVSGRTVFEQGDYMFHGEVGVGSTAILQTQAAFGASGEGRGGGGGGGGG